MEILDDLEIDEVNLGFFVKDLKILAQHYIERFFIDKSSLAGEPLTLEVISSPQYLDQVMDVDVCRGVDLIYNAIGVNHNSKEIKCYERKGQLPDDIKYIISLFRDCSNLGIPKCFASGIVIMYLELCKGYHIVLK